jgi:PPOX class probable FMN-dependent enzyme
MFRMTQWLEDLLAALDGEFAQAPKVMILATVDRAGAPHVRSVVCRKIDRDGCLYATIDARSEKNAQLRGDPRAEAAFWLPKLRMQFRINGVARIISFPQDESLRLEVWRGLSDESRSVYFWPTPGVAAAADDAFAEAVAADVPPPQTFEVMVLEPRQVDRLSLESHPHRRRVWRADTKWAGVDVNP